MTHDPMAQRSAVLGSRHRLRLRLGAGALSLIVAMAGWTATRVSAQTMDFTGQVRTRLERTDPTGPQGAGDGFASTRVRIGLSARLESPVSFLIQIQDVRRWGEETNTLTDFSADALDLHQGWVELGFGSDGAQTVRVGRQEIALGGQRLMGAVDWTQQGRSFDGVRAGLGDDRFRLDLIGVQLRDESSRAGGPFAGDQGLFGAYAVLPGAPGGSLDLYGILERDDVVDETSQTTVGARLVGATGAVDYRAEGSLQSGERDGDEVSAWMFGARVGRGFGERFHLTLWFDHLSGDSDPADGEIGVFSTLYATNHKFYGYADVFTDIPGHTAGLGLQDAAIKGAMNAGDDLSIGADLHLFRSAVDGVGGERDFGKELDVTATLGLFPGVAVSGGLARVFVGDGLLEIGRLREDRTFIYLMLDAVF